MGTPCKILMKDYHTKELIFFDNDNMESFNSCEIPEFRELVQLSISSDSESLIKVEGFDLIDGVDTDESGWWRIGKNPIYLYSYDNKMTEPLIPGYYQVLLKQNSDTIMYSWFKINPKNMSVSEWEIMRNDIESEVMGLSLDLKYRNTGNNHEKNPVILNNLLFNKIIVLSEELTNFTTILKQIILNPKNEIGKEYYWQEKGKKINIDQQTIKFASKFPEKKNVVYSGKRFVNYDISSNRELLHIISRLDLTLFRIRGTLEKYQENIRFEDGESKELKFVKDSLYIIDKYTLIIQELYAQPWAITILKQKSAMSYSKGIRDARYGYMYKFYLKISSNKLTKQLNSNYQLYWKRSDLLYEIWGYLKIITILKDSGYVPVSGWVFDDSSYEIPFIKAGTRVVFKKECIQLNVIYNEKIPRNNDGENVYDPIYIKAKNNKPDIRIDVFKNSSYYRSIVMDTKYRNFRNLWEKSEDVRTQLRNYKDSIKSKVLYKNSPVEDIIKHLSESITPVTEVWVLFPKSGNIELENKIHIDEKITFKEFSPSKDFEQIKKDLIDLIDNMINI